MRQEKRFVELEPTENRKSVLEQLLQKGIRIASNCGGSGICGKCKVHFLEGAPVPGEQDVAFFSKEELEAGYRLACTAYPTGKVLVEVGDFEEKMHILSSGRVRRTENEKPGKIKTTTYVIVIDIGTTTLAFWLVKRETGEVICVETGRNHGVSFGENA